MSLVVIKTYPDAFTVDLRPLIELQLNNVKYDRKFAKIKYSDIRSLNMENNDQEIEIVFTNGEIKTMDYNIIDTIDDEPVTSQQDFYNKMDAAMFPHHQSP